MQETWVQPLGWEDPLEKGKATHSYILAWRFPWATVHQVAKSQTWRSNFHFQEPEVVDSDGQGEGAGLQRKGDQPTSVETSVN